MLGILYAHIAPINAWRFKAQRRTSDVSDLTMDLLLSSNNNDVSDMQMITYDLSGGGTCCKY